MGAILSACSACACMVNCCSAMANCCRCGKSSTRARGNYFVMFVVYAIIAWILKDHGYDGLKHVGDMKNCRDDVCTGTGMVLRMSLAMVLLSSLLCILLIGVDSSKSPRAVIQNDFFGVKWILLGCTMVGTMYLSNQSAIEFGYVAAVGGGLFLVIGILLVLEFAYSLNDSLVEYLDNSGEKMWGFLILGIAFLCYAGSITIWTLLLVYYGGDGCDETNTFVALTIVFSVFVTLLTLPKKVEQGAILPCSVVVLYASWLCASAVLGMPVDNANSCGARHSGLTQDMEEIMKAGGIMFTIFCVGYATVRAASSGQDLTGGTPQSGNTTGMLDTEKGGAQMTEEAEPDEEDGVQYNYSFFQLVYALGAMYLAMVLINWQVTFQEKNRSLGTMSQWADVWIKMATQWVTFALYTWSLIAPLVCTGRDFG